MAEPTSMTDQLGLLKLLTSGRDTYQATRDAIKTPTAGEQFSGGLVEATKDIPQNTFAGGLVKGLAQGYDVMEKKKGATKREKMQEYLMAQEQYEMQRQKQIDETMNELAEIKQAAAVREIFQGNIDMGADAYQTTGDLSILNETLNNERAKPLRTRFEKQITAQGAVFQGLTGTPEGDIMPYGITPDGTRVYGQAMPVESLYSQTYLQNKQAKQLEEQKAAADLQKTQADTLKSLSDAGVSVPVDQSIIPTAAPQAAPQATPQVQGGRVADLVAPSAAPVMTKPKAKDDKAPSGYKFNDDGTLSPIAGGPADPSVKRVEPVSGEVAGKLSLVKQGQDAMARTKDIMFTPTPDGKLELNRGVVNEVATLSALQNLPLIGGAFPAGFSQEARELYTQLYNWNNAKLRLESGAAVPEQEVQRAVKAYMAGILDNASTANAKLSAPEKYFNDYLELMGRGSQPTTPQATPQMAPQALQANPQAAQIRAAYKAGQITREQARAELQALGAQ